MSTRISPKKSGRRNTALKFPPCVICDGKASGLHYGCNTCEACKNFFRRYLIRKNGYICSKKNECHISYINKSNCSACRLEKCLGFGMCRTKSKLGRYSYSRRTEAINKIKELEITDKDKTSPGTDVAIPVKICDSAVTIGKNDCVKYDKYLVRQLTVAVEEVKVYDEELQCEEVREAKCKQHYENFMLKINMFGSMNGVSMEEYQTLLRNHGIDIDGQYEAWLRLAGVWESIVLRYTDCIKKIPGFSELSQNDQMSLLKSTNFTPFMIMVHQGYSEEYNVFLEANGETFHVDECMDRLVSGEYIIENCRWMCHLQKLKLTKEEMALLIAISTFSGDCCKLENPNIVEKIQLDFVELLSQHLHAELDTKEASSRFIKLLDLLVRIRTLMNLYFKEMKVIKEDKMLMSAMPFCAELLPDDDYL